MVGGGSVVCCSFDKIRNPLVSHSMAVVAVYQVLACQEPGSVLCASDLVTLHRRSLLLHFTGEETVPTYHSLNLDFKNLSARRDHCPDNPENTASMSSFPSHQCSVKAETNFGGSLGDLLNTGQGSLK